MIKAILKNLLSSYAISRLQSLKQRADIHLSILASKYRWTAVIYYCVYSSEFGREMHSVLQGRRRYHESLTGENPNSYLLRRNIHRLEKGLTMQPRRAVFGEGYIIETIEFFQICLAAECLSKEEVNWAHSVISEYFLAVSATEIIGRATWAYQELIDASSFITKDHHKKAPYIYSSFNQEKINFQDFKNLCEGRRSVRWFENKLVPKDVIDAAIDVATTAPSACNRQPFKFYVFDTPEMAREMGSIPMGTAGFSNNFQAIIVVVGDLSAYPFEKDRHLIYIDTGLAVMQLQLALETQGLGSCTINWPDIERHERLMAEKLDLHGYERPVLLLAIGYPKKESLVPYSAKKNSRDMIERLK